MPMPCPCRMPEETRQDKTRQKGGEAEVLYVLLAARSVRDSGQVRYYYRLAAIGEAPRLPR
jgi:hypothetical protein